MVETIEYRWATPDLTGWREQSDPGPWDDEPDKVQFPDPKTGYACLVRRNHRLGFLCGYVGVPLGHPLYGKDSDEVELYAAHGEVNFASACDVDGDEQEAICHVAAPGEPEPLWWFGFDCGHAGDFAPALIGYYRDAETRLGTPLSSPWTRAEVYKTVEYVKEQCSALALQLQAAA